MRKLLLLIPVLAFALMANAKEIEVASGTSNIIHFTIAASTTEDGDVLILKDAGPYVSTKALSDDFTKLVKNLTIKAAPGIKPVIQLEVPFRSTGGKSVKFIGITFDGSSLHSDYSFYFRFYDNADNLEFEDCEFKNVGKYLFHVYGGKNANSLKLTNCKLHDISSRGILNEGTINNIEINGCEIYKFTDYPVLDNYSGATLGKVKINNTEFYNNAKDIISGSATSHADSCIIKNCYFHNNSRSAVYFAASTTSGVETCDGVVVKNSTFANNDLSASSRSVIEVQNYGSTEASNIEVTVDHCTFYNNATINYDYSCVRSRKSTKVSITNSIFAYPTAIDFYATNCYGGTISNTLVYNLNYGHRSSSGAPAISNTITANPLFTDAANSDFSLAGDWATGSISPAREAATNGSDLGDPRWYSDEVLPSTDFASPYILTGNKAKLSGRVAVDASNYLQYSNNSDASQHGVAIWKVRATRSCYLQATLNIDADNGSGHRYQIEVFDSNNALVGTAIGEPADSWNKGDRIISDLILLPEADDYKIRLSNLTNGSSNLLHSITLSYIGGAVQNMPGTTDIDDAWFSANGTRTAGTSITFPGSTIQDGWVKWNVSFAEEAYYDVQVNVNNGGGHNYTVALCSDESCETVVATCGEGGNKYTPGTPNAIKLGAIHVPAGNYYLKVTNGTKDSDAALLSVSFTYAGGNVINVSPSANTTLPVADAWFTQGFTRADGQVSPGSWKPEGQPLGYVKWNIATSETKFYDLTLNFSSDNAHSMAVNIYEDEEASPVATVSESYTSTTGTLTISDRINLIGGKNYVVVVTNPTSGSHAKVTSVVFAPEVSLVTTLPNTLDFNKAVLSEKAKVVGDELHFGEGEPGAFTPAGQWAQWQVTANNAGTFLFTMGVNSTLQQSYRITILDNLNNVVTTYDKNPDSGSQSITHYFYLEAGTYFVKVENTYSYSDGYIVSLVVTEPSLLSLDETATSAPAPADAQNIQIMRTFVGGMYNTICLPFGVGGSKLKEAFGSDVVLKKLNSAEFYEEGGILELNFEDAISGGAYQGTPYLIKPSQNIVNPVFESVEIRSETHAGSTSRNNADFIGTFVATDIPAGENNLFLGPNNLLYFNSNAATHTNGFRAWFVVHDLPNSSSGVNAIKHARIVEDNQVVTTIDFVKQSQNTNVQKRLENGQLIIIRDGVHFTVQGQRIQ